VGRRVVWILLIVSVVVSGVGAWIALEAAAEVQYPRRPVMPSFRGRKPVALAPRARAQQARDALFAELQPVRLANCEFARYGEENDGGYLACRNLLKDVQSAYSYGISGYDGWGCEVSTELKVPVHQYDCFNTTQPRCPSGKPVFHPECIAASLSTDSDGRVFDSMQSQFAKNGDSAKQMIVKIDVEGAEWDSMLSTPDEVFDRIDQMIFEFHGVDQHIARSLEVVLKLKRFFYVAHLHINNFSCLRDLQPFGGWAYEVTFVSKRLAKLDPDAGQVTLPNPLDSPNNPTAPDCQVPPGPPGKR
jgi:hypothetical protein